MKVITRVQWHTETDGQIAWRQVGDITDETVADLDIQLARGTVEALPDSVPAADLVPFDFTNEEGGQG